jgi:AraC-like DNA-binding protein
VYQKRKCVVLNNIGSIELLQASYTQQNFKKHFHEGFCFGVIVSGQLDFNYRGKRVHAHKGSINLCNPGEIHDGFTQKGWSYKMFYVTTQLMQEMCLALGEGNNVIPFFKEGMIEDVVLAKAFNELHDMLFYSDCFIFEKEEKFLEVLIQFIKKHSDGFLQTDKLFTCQKTIQKVKDYVHEHLTSALSVSDLAAVTPWSLYYFIRVFKQEVGLTPKEYIIQQRILKAKELILNGQALSYVALECGFYDQSHMLKYFKSYVGLNPSSLQ